MLLFLNTKWCDCKPFWKDSWRKECSKILFWKQDEYIFFLKKKKSNISIFKLAHSQWIGHQTALFVEVEVVRERRLTLIYFRTFQQ